jgi:two-component system, NarL family, invasion response regulator UvrY
MKILIVDDHPIIRNGLRRLLAADFAAEFREAATAREALPAFREQRPDLVVLDLNLPGAGGLDTIRRLKLEDETVRILVFTVHDDAIHVARAFEAGASGYITKNAPPDQILEAVRRIAAGQTYIEPDIAQDLALLNVRSISHPLKDLSRRDLEILRLLGAGRSLPQIAEAIGVSYKTVANNCGQIKLKLGVTRTAELVRIAIEHGISGKSGGVG